MSKKTENKLMSVLPAREFFGRERELDELLRHADGFGGLRIFAAPWGGASELLRQAADRLFFDRDNVVPFYFAFRPSDRSARKAMARFLREFIVQSIAFRRDDPAIYSSSPEVCELADLVPTADGEWLDRLIKQCDVDSPARDENSFIRNCLSAPLRVSASNHRVFVMIDDVHAAARLEHGQAVLAELADVYTRSTMPFVFSARRRFNMPGIPLKPFEIADLEGERAAEFVMQMAELLAVTINDQTRDLIAAQTGGRIGFIKALFRSAAYAKRPLDTFQHVEQIYTDAILKGSLGCYYSDVIDEAVASPATRRELIRLINDASFTSASAGLDAWQRTLKLNTDDLRAVFQALHVSEIASIDGSLVQVANENPVIIDLIRSRYRIEYQNEPRAVVVGDLLANALKRAPRMMARLYRRENSVGLVKLVSAFNSQSVPLAMLDYGHFRSGFKGLSHDEITNRMQAETDRIALPQIVHTAPAVEYDPSLNESAERERVVVAIGFNDQSYTDSGQIVWIAAEIESKLEADREIAEEWCKRLRHVGEVNDFSNYKIWLIATEGFSDGALDTLAQFGAMGSSRRQALLLADLLGTTEPLASAPHGIEYEMVIPVGEDTELIAAHALEEIARRHKFPSKVINQLKTALVEACINAAEHGLAPDRKIHQRFVVSDDRVTITISNRGIKLADKLAERDEAKAVQPVESESSDTRRGWGLNLIRGLMDDVRVEPVDDGTRITMTKILREEVSA